MKCIVIFIIILIILNTSKSIPVVNKDCFTWELCDAIGCTDRRNCWLGHTVGGFGDCKDCNYRDHRGYGYDCFSKKTHFLECKCVPYANPGCSKSTTQYAKISFQSYFGIDVSQKKVTKKLNLLNTIQDSDFAKGIKNLCKVIDGAQTAMDFLDNPVKTLIQETTHSLVEELVKNIVNITPLNKYEGVADFISIGINFALDKLLFSLRNLETRKLDNSYFADMLNFAEQINQIRGILLIKGKGNIEYNDKDYFGYDHFSARRVERKKLGTVSDLIKDDVDKILSDSKWKNEKYFIAIRTKTDNEELNKVYNYEKISLYAYNEEELIISKSNIYSNNNKSVKVKYYLLISLIALIFI